MKTYNFLKNIAGGIIVCGTLCTTSCTSFDELNTDPTRMDEVNPGTLLNPILYETSVYNWKLYNRSSMVTGVETGSLPTARTFGLNINLSF